MSEYTVLWNGTKHCPYGRLLFPPTITEPVSVRYVVASTAVSQPAVLSPEEISRAISRRNSRNRSGGEVYAAKDRIWAYLAEPHTVLDVIDTFSLPANATYSALGMAFRAGILVHAGGRANRRRQGSRVWSHTYRQAPAYRHRETWPHVVQTRDERATRITMETVA